MATRFARSPLRRPWGTPFLPARAVSDVDAPNVRAGPRKPTAAATSAARCDTQQPTQKPRFESVATAVKAWRPTRFARRPPTTLPTAPSSGIAVKNVATADGPRRHSSMAKIWSTSPMKMGWSVMARRSASSRISRPSEKRR